MFVVARHEGESVLLLDRLIEIKVLSITGKTVRLGFDAPREFSIERAELVVTTQQGEDGNDRG